MELGRIKPTVKTGQEYFHLTGDRLPHDLLGFWKWSSSNVLDNALRGVLAEYIVALDIGRNDDTRDLWDAYDLETPEGIKVEVKSASYLQSWGQKKLSAISFGIQPTHVLGEDGIDQKKKRQADVYVFCVLAHKDKSTVDPLNLNQWEFYVLPTDVLDSRRPEQKTIQLTPLLKLNPVKCRYGEIRTEIERLFQGTGTELILTNDCLLR